MNKKIRHYIHVLVVANCTFCKQFNLIKVYLLHFLLSWLTQSSKNFFHQKNTRHQKISVSSNKSNEKCVRALQWKLQTFLRKIKDLNKWRNIPCSRFRRFKSTKDVNSPPKCSTDLMQSKSQQVHPHLCRNWKANSTMYTDMQRT